MPEYLPSLTQPERNRLKQLEKEIWKESEMWDNLKRKHVKVRDVKRPCTLAELEEIFALIERRSLPCDITGHGHFDGVALHLYEHAEMPDADPEYLFTVCHDHFPGTGAPREKFPEAFKRFGEIVNSERNKQFIKFYKLEETKEVGHYLY